MVRAKGASYQIATAGTGISLFWPGFLDKDFGDRDWPILAGTGILNENFWMKILNENFLNENFESKIRYFHLQ